MGSWFWVSLLNFYFDSSSSSSFVNCRRKETNGIVVIVAMEKPFVVTFCGVHYDEGIVHILIVVFHTNLGFWQRTQFSAWIMTTRVGFF